MTIALSPPSRRGTLASLACALFAAAALAAAPVSPSSGAPDDQAGASAEERPREFPDEWFYRNGRTRQRYAGPLSLEGRLAPELKLKDWIGEPQDLEKLRGKIVVVDFWATWCGPCRAAIPKNVEMAEKYEERDVVIIGVHDSKRGFQSMPAVAEGKKINYPLAVDDGGVSQKAWKVGFWPTYAVVDHHGVVRAAGLLPHHVENVVQELMRQREAEKKKSA